MKIDRIEVQGWIQVVIGVVGIWLTAAQSQTALIAIAQVIETGSAPDGFGGAGGAIRLFPVIFVMILLLAIALIGLGVAMGALTLALAGSSFWIPFVCLTTVAVILAGLAAADREKVAFWMVGIFGIGLSLMVGGGIAMALASGSPTVSDWNAASPPHEPALPHKATEVEP